MEDLHDARANRIIRRDANNYCIGVSAHAHTPKPLDQTPHIKLRIKPNGAIVWNGQTMNDFAFENRLADLAKCNPHPKAYLLPSKRATYSRVEHPVEIMQRHGVNLEPVATSKRNKRPTRT